MLDYLSAEETRTSQGVGIAVLAAQHSGALEIVDRLVAKAEVARHPGYLYGVTALGSKRLRLLSASPEKARDW